jgi:3-hydroxyisobutyrate dehydrogenase
MSTVGLDWTERFAAAAREAGAVFVDAPSLGSIGPAERGELTVLASGPDEARERAAPIFDAVGSSTRWLGESGAGTRLKLVFNFWILATTAAAGETLALAEHSASTARASSSRSRAASPTHPTLASRGR